MSEKLKKEELIKLVEKICNPKLSEEEVSEYIDILEQNVPHSAPSDLIFWSDTMLTPEEIVEIALNYKETIKGNELETYTQYGIKAEVYKETWKFSTEV
ncbi:hypothetical protein EEL30_12090 [Brevibacillus laterosporus]|uniref:Uncharacterized protein n=1 Tax=Brevibacillus laterosporus TaxID=1465 RepID=A0A518V7J6_BRELA|nr:hypothetical protein EEL30_12090 [Brevibacillus laterosporus]